MKKEFIPYEQALELKELGFIESCYAFYHREDKPHLGFCANGFQDDTTLEIKCTAPLYQQAFRWFREKYGLIGWVEGKRVYRWCIESPIPTDGQLNFSPFKTYEEAELECLKKLIEIVKVKL